MTNQLASILLSATLTISSLTAIPASMLPTASALNTDITLRVGLYYGSSALGEAKLENVGGYATGYTVGTMDGTTFQPETELTPTQLTMMVNSTGAIAVYDTVSGDTLYTAPVGTELAIRPHSAETWCKGYKWYGDFVYRIENGSDVAVLNYVSMEDYVKGVLPYEVDPDWSIEALKAQAVCARSFALGTHKHSDQGFDVCNTTNCQVYLGTNRATGQSNKAVDLTAGEYLTYQGEPVVGYFFSSDGGATEDAANVWGGEYPYLKGKIDPYEDIERAYNGVWSVTMTADEVQEKLQEAGYSIGTVVAVEVTKRTPTDNVAEVTITDEDGQQVTIRKGDVRSVFGLNSIRYTITPHVPIDEVVKEHIQQTAAEIKNVGISTHKIAVDGALVAPQGYLINRENYFKLRDVAYILSETDAQFNVEWDNDRNCIILTGGEPYETVGGELEPSQTAVTYLADSDSSVFYNGEEASMTGYRIDGNNYYRIRDIAKVIGFDIDYEPDTRTVQIDSTKHTDSIMSHPGNANEPGDTDDSDSILIQKDEPLEDNNVFDVPPQSYTFDGTGWGHSVGMSQYGALGMAQQGKDYREILQFYYTDIEIAHGE